ncbi:MAG: host attachment protein [Acidobacteria bacterium]|nr:host attachment protein [Acidobacteriota bacterium]
MALTEQLDRLARFEPAPYPVVSLYLNTQPGPTGRDQYQTFVRAEFKARSRTYPGGSPERESLDKDLERIATYLRDELQPAANGVALFACSAGELFEAVQLPAPIDEHWLYIGDTPHLYPLARVESQYPRYAAVVADTNSTRILVFATGELVAQEEVMGVKTRRTSQGGWSQARFQRHIENYHVQHVKDVVETLDRIVTQEGIQHIVIAADEVVLPLLREQMPKHLTDSIVDHLKVDSHASVRDVLDASLEAMRKEDARTDREKVDGAISGYRGGGLGVVGPEGTLEALVKGQVDELLITASAAALQPVTADSNPTLADDSTLLEPAVETAAAGEAAQADPQSVRLADELVTRAKQTAARLTFIEDASLLEEYGGVAALLRFRI